ncbi:MAG TPA: protease pro-enzyme activation domain-containing protein [Chlamydiales bacterium]|nr:protease pro-enzyme activation domain-containing protein [Chlamydiales bacterium]
MKNRLFGKCFLFSMLTLILHANTASAQFVELSDHVPTKAVNKAVCTCPLESDKEVHIHFVLPLRNQQELQELIDHIYDPSDPQHYGKYLTSAEFIERFAPLQQDYDTVIAYANSLELTIHDTHPNRTLLHVSGPAHRIESAFHLRLHQHTLPTGRQFYAPNKNPELHVSVASIISGIVGLDNHAEWHSYHRCKDMSALSSNVSNTFPSGPNGGFAPQDIVTAYNLSGMLTTGAHQIIALFELADYQASDITTYANYFGLPSPKLTNILIDGGSFGGIHPEVALDIELAIALAPESEIYVYQGPNSYQGALDTYNRIATDNLARQVSTSWGLGEDMLSIAYLQAEHMIFQQMAAQGQTIYAASGDNGAYDDYSINFSQSLVVNDPSSQPYVVSVGGTHLTVNPLTGAYLAESVWNNGLGHGAGGGGVSAVWPIPLWQTNISTVYSKSYRNVPDIALDADPNTGYAIYYDGMWQIYGGTSCAAPLWAAFTACVNQELAAAQKPALGFANPKFYAIGSGEAYLADFHDVTTGNNLYYNALQGYDNASGWGSFNGANLYASLTQSTTAPLCNIILKHNAPFTKGDIGTYRIVVFNTGNALTTSPVTVAIALPDGLKLSSFTGSGWVLSGDALSFTQQNALQPGERYPTIVLNVNVANTASYALTPTATVSGGGSPSQTVANFTTAR